MICVFFKFLTDIYRDDIYRFICMLSYFLAFRDSYKNPYGSKIYVSGFSNFI